jgi:flagellar hook-associated protein 3 FlgL
MIFDAGVNSINRQTATLLHLQQQVASGRRILTPSDDPVAAARALEVTQSQEITAQFKLTHNNANSALGLEEAQLSSSTDLLARVRELTVQAGNTTLSSSDRRAITSELRARFEELIGIANATDGAGQYLFSGFMGATKPFGGSVESILAGGEIVYSGDDGQRKLQVSPSRFLDVSDSGNDVFKRIRNGNGDFVTGYPRNGLGVGTNTGTGIIDAGSITDPAAWTARPTNSFSVNFSVDNTVVPPVTYYDIVDTDPASASFNNSMLTGAPPTLPPTAATGQRVYQSGQPITLVNQGAEPAFNFGGNVMISGTPASGDSFTIAPSSSQSIFATVAKLIGAMESATTGSSAATANLANDIGFALTNLDKATDNILGVRAQIGSRMAEIDSLSSVNEDLNLQYQQTLSQLQDLDYAKTISDLTRKQTDLQAAQQSFVMMSQLSLFNYL